MAEYIVKTDGDGWGTKAGELIRCKDCKYYEGHYCWRQMKIYLIRVSDMDYCSRGERKEETE